MIFGCDLDRTMIYSSSFLNTLPETSPYQVVELREGIPLSYMTTLAIEQLQVLTTRLSFIPVTSRSLEQYLRIDMLHTEIHPSAAIVSNGGILLIDGQPEPEWTKRIRQLFKDYISPEQLLPRLEFIRELNGFRTLRICDDNFIYVVMEQEADAFSLQPMLHGLVMQHGYTAFQTGRKIYLMPNFMDKQKPLKYLMERYGDSDLIAAGDSELDLPMLTYAETAIIPAHHSFAPGSLLQLGNYIMTKSAGPQAFEEILSVTAELYQKARSGS